jgi:glucosamine--fructose-6-phosphate aminotransferase (isomerizing)
VEGALSIEQESRRSGGPVSLHCATPWWSARGLNYANAFEFGLKMMETCYVVAERFFGGRTLCTGRSLWWSRIFRCSPSLRPDVTWPSLGRYVEPVAGSCAPKSWRSPIRRNRDVAARATRVIRLPKRL